MKEDLKMPDLSSYGKYYKSLGIDANVEIMKFIREQCQDSNDKWFADQMDNCVTDTLKDNVNSDDFEKYKYILIGV